MECIKDDDCSSPLYCQEGTCSAPRKEGHKCDPNSIYDECRHFSENHLLRCSQNHHRCRYCKTSEPCSNDPEYLIQYGKYNVNTDCAYDEYLSNGICFPLLNSGMECQKEYTCESGYVCSKNLKKCVLGCKIDGDCNLPNEVCLSTTFEKYGGCHEQFVAPGLACTNEKQCTQGYVCSTKSNKCVKQCYHSSDCLKTELCNNQVLGIDGNGCNTALASGAACYGINECDQVNVCSTKLNKCVRKCSLDNDCNTDEMCLPHAYEFAQKGCHFVPPDTPPPKDFDKETPVSSANPKDAKDDLLWLWITLPIVLFLLLLIIAVTIIRYKRRKKNKSSRQHQPPSTQRLSYPFDKYEESQPPEYADTAPPAYDEINHGTSLELSSHPSSSTSIAPDDKSHVAAVFNDEKSDY